MANGILVSPVDVMTPVVGSIKEKDSRVFTIKYGIENQRLTSLKQVETVPNLTPNSDHNVNPQRQHFGFLRVSSFTQSIRVYS